tara:strand:- start:60 stop:503 length:444 start_codon:yes stop_codon:yes gene_type:complete
MKLRKARFTFTEYEDFPIFNGWYDPNNRYWNGWSNPYFDKPTRDSFIALEKSLLDETYKGKPYTKEDADFLKELESIKPTKKYGKKELYYFGGFLCWDQVGDNEKVSTMVDQLGWEYQRMGSSGRRVYKRLCLELGWNFEWNDKELG